MKENYLMNYDEISGEIKGFYLKSIHGNNIPIPFIEITDEKHDFYMKNQGKYKLNINTLEDELIPISEIPQPKTEIETLKEQLEEEKLNSASVSTTLMDFMNFYFEMNPEL